MHSRRLTWLPRSLPQRLPRRTRSSLPRSRPPAARPPAEASSMAKPASRTILRRHLNALPYFRALIRAVEDQFYQGLSLPRPLLDIGCGDGHFASVALDRQLDLGLDPSPIVRGAAARGGDA